MNLKSTKCTALACYNGYFTQAIIVMLPPLLFAAFHEQFHISLTQIGMLTVINFTTQIIVDFIGARIVEKVNPRILMLLAHSLALVGLLGFSIFPFVLPAYLGLVIATVINAIGGGLLEVIISPIIESLPGDEKAAAMSLLHSFYCWGCVVVILLSTVYLALVPSWQLLPALWAIIPLVGIFAFSVVPLFPLTGEEGGSMLELFKKPVFWLLMLLMLCAGASEQAIAQWSSYFAQMGLEINKTIGDLAGPMAFSVLMGLTRLAGARKNIKTPILYRLLISAAFCVFCYLLTILSPSPFISLIGCALCGIAVASMWPGTFSLAAEWFPRSGGMLFALLALGGDLGCAAGPGLVGIISDASAALGELGALKTGLAVAIAFPLVMTVCLFLSRKRKAE